MSFYAIGYNKGRKEAEGGIADWLRAWAKQKDPCLPPEFQEFLETVAADIEAGSWRPEPKKKKGKR